MALETISQILSPTNATYINGVSAERRFAAAVLANMYQGLVEKDGRGVMDKFVTSSDAEESAQVFVNRILPVKMKPREQGANKNGASFSQNQHYTQTETVGIDILSVLDDTIIIPRARQDMIKVDLLAEQTKIYSDRLRTILNGATAASKVLAVLLAESKGEEVNKATITDNDVANKEVLTRFIEANSLLDEGDTRHGVDIFPEDTRVAVFKTSYRATLKTGGILQIGGANYAYDIAKGDAVSHGDKATKTEDGYVGTIDGVPCHLISNESLQHASEFMGFPENELKASPFIGYVASSYANARGVSTNKQIKVVDAVSGQGVVLQPYTKFGVATWYPKGVVLLAKEDGYSPFKTLKELITDGGGDASQVVFKLKGAGSRLFADVTSFNVTSSGFTLNASAVDDFGYDHIVFAYYITTQKEVKTVSEFLTCAAKDEPQTVNEGGAFTPGSAVSVSVGTDYVTCLLVADDGSCTLVSKKA